MKIVRRVTSRPDGSISFRPIRSGSSRILGPGSSGILRPGSSRPEAFSRGGLDMPIILEDTILVDTVGTTTATIVWELDPAGPAGYHRVKYGALYSDYSLSASYSASVDLAGLTSENTAYTFQVQSCTSPGSGCSAWTPISGLVFYTLCVTPLVYSGVNCVMDPEVIVVWTSNTPQKHRTRWRLYPSGVFYAWTSWSGSYVTNHAAGLVPPLTPLTSKQYQIQIQGQNKCGELGPTPNYLLYYSGGVWRTIAQ